MTNPIPKRLLRIERADCLWLERALRREWLETNGLGGYASMSILMCPTRRFHGLLVAQPPHEARRHVFLARFEESLHGGEKSFPISMARYPGVWSPPGHQSIESFELVPYPSSVYRIGPTGILRQVLMVKGAPTVLCRYRLLGERGGLELKLRPLFACRPADALTRENIGLNPRVERIPLGIRVAPYAGLPPVSVTLSSTQGRFDADPVWYRNFEYRADLARGYEGHEDQFSPGWFTIPMELEHDIVIAATIAAPVALPLELWEEESARRRGALAAGEPGLRGRLALAGEHFIFRSQGGRVGVMAGFPWATEHGRDTFISLPGLTLSRGQAAACGEALEGTLPFLRRGLMPSVFGASPELSIYAAPDPALWFARAVRLYDVHGGARARDHILRRFAPALAEIANSFREGRAHGIGVDDGGLLATTPGNGALTWMDACSAHGPVTPRYGASVETNALWYFLLAYLEELARARGAGGGAEAEEWCRHKERAGSSFLRRFWLEDLRYLADTWSEGLPDPTVRPNMVIAAALEFSPLTHEHRAEVAARAAAELLTPFGLRTLTPRHPHYQGRYEGGPVERDEAYHQGSAWPWLLGFYCEAYLRAHGFAEHRRAVLRGILDGFAPFLALQGMNQVYEVFDGDPPHRHAGCYAQAWSVAELLRAVCMVEDGVS